MGRETKRPRFAISTSAAPCPTTKFEPRPIPPPSLPASRTRGLEAQRCVLWCTAQHITLAGLVPVTPPFVSMLHPACSHTVSLFQLLLAQCSTQILLPKKNHQSGTVTSPGTAFKSSRQVLVILARTICASRFRSRNLWLASPSAL